MRILACGCRAGRVYTHETTSEGEVERQTLLASGYPYDGRMLFTDLATGRPVYIPKTDAVERVEYVVVGSVTDTEWIAMKQSTLLVAACILLLAAGGGLLSTIVAISNVLMGGG